MLDLGRDRRGGLDFDGLGPAPVSKNYAILLNIFLVLSLLQNPCFNDFEAVDFVEIDKKQKPFFKNMEKQIQGKQTIQRTQNSFLWNPGSFGKINRIFT